MYTQHGVNLSPEQAKKIMSAHNKGTGTTIKLSKTNLQGNYLLPLTRSQLNKINSATKGITLTLSKSQLKHMEKTGGFIPLLTLIPIIASALGAAGGVAGGVASAVNSAKANAEQARHNRAVEQELAKSGSGVVSNFVGNIPLLGGIFKPLLERLGLGINDIDKLQKGDCIRYNGFEMKKVGKGLFLSPDPHS